MNLRPTSLVRSQANSKGIGKIFCRAVNIGGKEQDNHGLLMGHHVMIGQHALIMVQVLLPPGIAPSSNKEVSTIRTLGTDLHQIVPNILLLTHLPVVLDRHPPGVPMGHSGLVSDILRIASKKVHLNPQHLVGAMHPVADRKLGGLSRKAVSQVHLTKRQQQCLMIFQSISLPLVSSLLRQRKIPPLRAPAL